nr:stage III sporulation protein AF [Paenibacillus dakarensis]
MGWLGEWLKSVIMVVMFAAFVELILPGKAMRRYARLVLSMLILLALLRPVINLLTVSPERQLALELMQMENGPNTPKTAGLESILAQAEQLKLVQQRQSLQWAAQEVAKQMKEQIAAETGEQVGEVQVVLAAPKDSAGSVKITYVEVKLRDQEKAGADKNDGSGEHHGVKPVDPIRVSVGMKMDDSSNDLPSEQNSIKADREADTRAGPIRDLLSSRWNLTPEQIEIWSVDSEANTKL